MKKRIVIPAIGAAFTVEDADREVRLEACLGPMSMARNIPVESAMQLGDALLEAAAVALARRPSTGTARAKGGPTP